MSQLNPWVKRLPMVIGALLIVLVIGLTAWLIISMEKPVQAKKQVQTIAVVTPPPPPPPPPEPPPPPPPEEKIPEPEQQPEPEPEPQPNEADEPPPGDDLEGAGAEGQDSFGLRHGSGKPRVGGGGGGNAMIWYGQQVQRGLLSALESRLKDTDAKRSAYSVIVNVWVAPDGTASRFELANSTGRGEIDSLLKSALAGLQFRIDRPAPPDMPQPVKIRFSSKT